jgi:MFS family permease
MTSQSTPIGHLGASEHRVSVALRSVWVVIATTGVVQIANALQTDLLSVRAGIESFPPWTIGFVMSSYYVGYSIGPLVGRYVVSHLGHVTTLMVTTACAAFAIATHAFLISPLAWAFLRAISGLALALFYTAVESWIHDRVGNTARGRVFATYMLAQMISMTFAQWLLSIGNPAHAGPFLLASALFAAAIAFPPAGRKRAPHKAPPEPFGLVRLFAVSPLGATVTVLSGISWSVIFTFGPVYAQRSGFNLHMTSTYIAMAMIGGAISQFPLGWLSDHWGRRPTLALMSAAALVSSLFGFWADRHGAMSKEIASLLLGAFVFTLYAISAARTNDFLDSRNRVAAAAGLVLLFGLGSIVGPLLSGAAVSTLGNGGYFIVLAVVTSASLASAVLSR